MSQALKDFKPDVVHIHNFFPLLSPRFIEFVDALEAQSYKHCTIIGPFAPPRCLCGKAEFAVCVLTVRPFGVLCIGVTGAPLSVRPQLPA